jgi:large subunit GTPase 1
MTRKNQGKKIGPGASLGRAIVNSRMRNNRDRGKQIQHELHGLHATDVADEPLKSITDMSTLDELLQNAIEKEEFYSEKTQAVILDLDAPPAPPQDPNNSGPQIIYPRETFHPELYDYQNLPILRRPVWNEQTTPEELRHLEEEAFLKWRRGLADMEENAVDKKMTPFEKNLGIWRQLWRVVERSTVLCQIVDARNPLLFRCKDLEDYVASLGKKNLLIVNKADFLSDTMRDMWQTEFKKQGIEFLFFSAAASQLGLDNEKKEARQQQRDKDDAQKLRKIDEEVDHNSESEESGGEEKEDLVSKDEAQQKQLSNPPSAQQLPSPIPALSTTSILTRKELLTVLHSFVKDWEDQNQGKEAPSSSAASSVGFGCTIGMVGYPNVGKSSTINALMGQKKTNVGITPGKTKHFQTLVVSDSLCLCDCPGLVFPTFATSAANLVCNGILPIDQLRDVFPPLEELCRRVSKEQIADVYGLNFPAWQPLSGEGLVDGYCRARGYFKDHGTIDHTRAARTFLKDFIMGKLLYCHPPSCTPEQRLTFAQSLALGEINAMLIKTKLEEEGEGEEGETAGSDAGAPEPLAIHVNRTKLINVKGDDPDEFQVSAVEIAKKTPVSVKQAMRQAKPRNKRVKARSKHSGDGSTVQAHIVTVKGIDIHGSIRPGV